MQRGFASELKARLDAARASGFADIPEDEESIRAMRLQARLAQVQNVIEARVPDVRLHRASAASLSGRALGIAKEAAGGRSFFLTGSKGAGKSFVCVAAMRLRLERVAYGLSRHESERFFDEPVGLEWTLGTQYVAHDWLIRDLQQAHRDDGDPRAILDRYASADWLIFDDLGARTKLSQFAADETATLIDARYTKGRATLFTSNLRFDEIENMLEAAGTHVGERAISRIHGIIRGTGLGPDDGDLWPQAEPITVDAYDRRKGRA